MSIRRCALRTAFLGMAALVASATSPVAAADGTLEINQTCALQTGCFAGDAAGFPVTINGSAGRSYRLTSDLQVPNRDTSAVLAPAGGVSIDLNAFAIIGPVTCSFSPWATCGVVGTGDGISGGNLLSLRNGTVQGMGRHGIALGFAKIERHAATPVR